MRALSAWAVLGMVCSSLFGAEQNPCASCHAKEVEAFQRSAMGRSLSVQAGQPNGLVRHKASKITIHSNGEQMVHRVDANGLSAEYPVAYAVGAGVVGFSYLVSIPPYLFQSPVSYYSQTRAWDVTPGYEPERVVDFTQPVVSGCVFCHAGKMNLVPGTDNQFRKPELTPISCERCHGDARAHLEKPVVGSIVNPAKLQVRERDSVCEQCHLEGDARVLNPGQHWANFRPGVALESVFVTYLRRVEPKQGVKAVSHVEQLSASRCARASGGKLWCGSCHDPHSAAVGSERVAEVRGVCLSCHASTIRAERETGRHPAAEECVSCHMPRIRPNNVSHAAITDHTISLPHRGKTNDGGEQGRQLTAWRSPAEVYVERDLGLALFESGGATKNVNELKQAYEMLAKLPHKDPEVLATLGALLLQQKHEALAVELLQSAIQLQPKNARFEYLLGAIYAEAGKSQLAISALRKSIELDRSAPEAYRELEKVYEAAGRKDLEKEVVREYLEFMPQSLEFRLGVGR